MLLQLKKILWLQLEHHPKATSDRRINQKYCNKKKINKIEGKPSFESSTHFIYIVTNRNIKLLSTFIFLIFIFIKCIFFFGMFVYLLNK